MKKKEEEKEEKEEEEEEEEEEKLHLGGESGEVIDGRGVETPPGKWNPPKG